MTKRTASKTPACSCPACTGTPAPTNTVTHGKYSQYCRATKDFGAYLDGIFVGYHPTGIEADKHLDELRYEQLKHAGAPDCIGCGMPAEVVAHTEESGAVFCGECWTNDPSDLDLVNWELWPDLAEA